MKYFCWNNPYLFKYYSDHIFWINVPNEEQRVSSLFCHDQACGGFLSLTVDRKSLTVWGQFFENAYKYCKCCIIVNSWVVTRMNIKQLYSIVVTEPFNMWGTEWIHGTISKKFFRNSIYPIGKTIYPNWLKLYRVKLMTTRFLLRFSKKISFLWYTMSCYKW